MKVDGTNLAAARERVFMSQEELAVVMRLEAAERTEVRENLGEDLAQILFVGRSELSSYPDPPKPVESAEPEGLPDIGEQKP
jgi:hypothetical protein